MRKLREIEKYEKMLEAANLSNNQPMVRYCKGRLQGLGEKV